MRGPAAQLAEELRARGEVKGEIALVIAPPSEDEEAGIVPVGAAAADPDEALREDIRAALEEGEPASAVAKRLSQKYSRRKRDVYAHGARYAIDGGYPALALESSPVCNVFLEDKPYGSK